MFSIITIVAAACITSTHCNLPTMTVITTTSYTVLDNHEGVLEFNKTNQLNTRPCLRSFVMVTQNAVVFQAFGISSRLLHGDSAGRSNDFVPLTFTQTFIAGVTAHPAPLAMPLTRLHASAVLWH